jgi:hypothetical protein
MKVALLGTRGIPANYGGFETCAEEVAVGLAERGHDVTVYCRNGNVPAPYPAEFKGVKLIHQPCLPQKALQTLSHTALSMVHAMTRGYDVLLVFNAANSPLCVLPKLFGKKIAINVDGL